MGNGVIFDWRDVVVHSAVTWAVFCAVSCVGGLAYALTDPDIITFGTVAVLVIAATGGSVVAVACCAPAAWLLGRLLRPVRSRALHVGAFALLGGVAGLILDRIGSFLVGALAPWGQADPTWDLARGAMVAAASAVCCAAGRLVAWQARRR